MSALHERIRIPALLGLAIATCLASTANATIIYSGPSTYTIDSTVNDNVIVNNSAAVLNVESGGVVQGVNDPTVLGAVRTQAGTLNVRGNGRIEAGAGQSTAISMRGNPAIVRLSEQASVTGNVVMEFTPAGWSTESSSVQLHVQDQAEINGNLVYAGYVRLQDQARINGNISNGDNGSIRLDMLGGEVAGTVTFGGLNDYVFNMSGGSILGGFRGAAGYVDMTMTGGYIGNGFRTGDAVDGTIRGGKIDGGIELFGRTGGGSNLIVTGGRFDTVAGDYLLSMTSSLSPSSPWPNSLDILGGQWGYDEAGLGFLFDTGVNFSITGWDLTFIDGLLSGYLLDGSWFSNQFTFGANWYGTFTINNVPQNVPEPGTLGLLLASAVGMMFARRRRAAG
nr:PEP-CTERM sorting domain-containing protein [uncultured Steroidobacter sp.]